MSVKSIRGVLRRLPVLREPEVQRALALVGVASRTCERCEHFDHGRGQRDFVMSSSPTAQAMRHLGPAQFVAGAMGAAEKGELDPDDGFKPKVSESDPLRTLTWADAGLCMKHGALVFRPHTCEAWR